MTVVLILGSGPNVVQSRDWSRSLFDRIVAINNAWAVRTDWDDLIHPEDFPSARKPTEIGDHQRVITAEDYVSTQNQFGGFVYAGGTMAFTAAYWALATLKPSVIGVMGCDMIYPRETKTHFYGTGTADPLRDDITLRDLSAKSSRLQVKAAQAGCAMVNLSTDDSRLVFPRATPQTVHLARPAPFGKTIVAEVSAQEERLGYFVESGRYWEAVQQFDPSEIDALDALWLRATQPH